MIESLQLKIEKKLPFDANEIERQFKEMNLDVLRWAVTGCTDKYYIIEAGIIKNL